MSKKFFTADHHFGHENIIKHCKRPFADVEEMNRVMVERWNAVVGPNDIVYHVGDIAYKFSRTDLRKIREQLNGQIYLVPGNHDKVALEMRDAWKLLPQCAEVSIGSPRQRIVLCHYALRVWNLSFHGAWHLYGHSHGTLPDNPHSLSFDVGVDCTNFTPMSEEEVIAKMTVKIAMLNRYAPKLHNPPAPALAADGEIYNQGIEKVDE
jgi:calcineurin-like phosphoesterase family protein